LSDLASAAAADQETVDDMPFFQYGDQVEFYYLESSFPYNVPANVEVAAGSYFNNFVMTSAAMGIWNKDSNVKISVQFVCTSYVDALFPTVVTASTTSGKALQWNNGGKIVVTEPLSENEWLDSRLVATSTGSAYQNIVDTLQNYEDDGDFTFYQPVNVLNPQALNPSLGTDNYLVQAQNSYYLTMELFRVLSDTGVDLESFASLFLTSFSYATEATPVLLQWAAADGPPVTVTDFFVAAKTCYNTKFSDVQGNSAAIDGGYGGMVFLNSVIDCYANGTAYIYASATSVWEITLSPSQPTPQLLRFPVPLPPGNDDLNSDLSAMDILVLVSLGSIFVILILVMGRHMWLKKSQPKGAHLDDEFRGAIKSLLSPSTAAKDVWRETTK